MVMAFARWKLKFNKAYQSPEEEIYRLDAFASHYWHIEGINRRYGKGEISWYAGLNKFSDMSYDDFKAGYMNNRVYTKKELASEKQVQFRKVDILKDPPAEKDWRKSGKLLPIQD